MSKTKYVPKKYGLAKRRLAKPFAAADFETILDRDGNHRVVAAGYRYYPSGSQGLPRSYTFTLDTKNLTEENLTQASQEFVVSFILTIKNFLYRKAQRLQSKADRGKVEPTKLVVYFHNLGSFDGVFILEALQKNPKLGEFEPLLRNRKIYELRLDSILIRDSYLLLPASLNELGQSFLGQTKEDFPLPELSLEAYKEHKQDLEFYMRRDLDILGDVLKAFQKEIREDFDLDIAMSLSLSGLSYQIYRSKFMPIYSIHISTEDNQVQEFLQEAYLGGYTEVYKPRPKGRVYAYDLNSAYPYAMAANPLPEGPPRFIERVTKESFANFFGFVEATVFVEEKAYIPPLVIRHQTEGSLLSPTGLFRGVFFSEELRQALDDGMTRVILFHKGYAYRRQTLFGNFVRSIYRRRLLAEVKDEGGRAFIYKRLLNSLYGRFAMKNLETYTRILKNEDLDELRHYQSISNPKPLEGTESTLVTLHTPFKEPSFEENPTEDYLRTWEKNKEVFDESHVPADSFFIATQISAATTAYARMQIFYVKKQLLAEGYELYYSDTDSVYIDKPLPEDHPLLGPELGKLKLEGSYEKALFLATKVYILVQNGKEKIVWKGLPRPFLERLSFEDFLEAWQDGDPFTGDYETFFKKKLQSLTVSKEILSYTASFNFRKREKVYKRDETGKEVWVDTKPRFFLYLANEIDDYDLSEIHRKVTNLIENNLLKKSLESPVITSFEDFGLYLRALYFGAQKRDLNGSLYHIAPLVMDNKGNSHYIGPSFQVRTKVDSIETLRKVGGTLDRYHNGTFHEDEDFWGYVTLQFNFYDPKEKTEVLKYAHALSQVLMDKNSDLILDPKDGNLSTLLEKYPLLAKVLDRATRKIRSLLGKVFQKYLENEPSSQRRITLLVVQRELEDRLRKFLKKIKLKDS